VNDSPRQAADRATDEAADGRPPVLQGKRAALVGRLASMPKREAARLLRRHGAVLVPRADAQTNLIVLGERDLPWPEAGGPDDLLDDAMRAAFERGELEVVVESDLWQRLGLIDFEQEIHRLYTPAMLAELLDVPVAVIRRWHRRGLIVPAREVRRLPYFDFQEVATARRLAELLAAGVSPAAIEKKLGALSRYLPSIERPLAQLSVIVEGKEILLRRGDGLVEPGGQRRFDFEGGPPSAEAPPPREPGPPTDSSPEAEQASSEAPAADHPSTGDADERSPVLSGLAPEIFSAATWRQTTPTDSPDADSAASAKELEEMADELEIAGQLPEAADMVRAAMAAGGPTPELCFRLADLLYRLGQAHAARERYYMAIELDEDFVEARANLGCVLAETGELELAVAAFQGALAFHGDYADVHYHLARVLDRLSRFDEARGHWESFLSLAPNSPWAAEARRRLEKG
jgi:tetratricopeptide (TPR) repeat protein